MTNTDKKKEEIQEDIITEQGVIYRITYDNGRSFYTHIVHSLRDCFSLCREAEKRGLKPKREKIRKTLDYHAITTVF